MRDRGGQSRMNNNGGESKRRGGRESWREGQSMKWGIWEGEKGEK